MVSKRVRRKGRNGKTVTLSRRRAGTSNTKLPVAALQNRGVTRQSPPLKSVAESCDPNDAVETLRCSPFNGLGTNAHSLLCYQYLLARSSYCTRGRRSRLRAEAYRFYQDRTASAEYLKVNSKARVPAMVTPRGILTETPAMLAFIAQSFPDAALAPLNDVFAFAELQSFNSYMCSTLHVRMLKGPWVMGDNYTIADPYLFTLAQWLEDDGVKPERIPRVIEHRNRVAERPSVKRAIAAESAVGS
jgi:glutathione S-transferase